MLLIWLYISWLILLFGSNLAFYVQNPSSLKMRREGFEISNRVKERLALLLMQIIARNHHQGNEPPSLHELTEEVSAPQTVVRYVLKKLMAKQLLIESNQNPVGYLPAKALDVLMVFDVINAVRIAEEERFLSANMLALPNNTLAIAYQMDEAIEQALENKTMQDLVLDTTQ